MRKLQIPILATLWLLNPVINGCQGSTYSYGVDEMLVLMDTVNDTMYEVEKDGETYTLDFELEQTAEDQASLQLFSFSGSAHACSQEFFASASACAPSSSLYVNGTVTLSKADGEVVFTDDDIAGYFTVDGYELTNASLEIYPSEYFEDLSLYSEDGVTFEPDLISW